MIKMRRQKRRPRSSILQLPLTAGLLLLCLHRIPLPVRRRDTRNDHPLPIPWPCLFASASSITHRVASSLSQSSISSSSSLLIAESILSSSSSSRAVSSRELQNNNNANNGQSSAKTDDSVDYEWMKGVNFNDVSIMPVSCVN
jgi:hypothetical protein